jgi:hypothetical protein
MQPGPAASAPDQAQAGRLPALLLTDADGVATGIEQGAPNAIGKDFSPVHCCRMVLPRAPSLAGQQISHAALDWDRLRAALSRSHCRAGGRGNPAIAHLASPPRGKGALGFVAAEQSAQRTAILKRERGK